MSGRSGKYNKETETYEKIVYLPVTAENDFKPELPKERVDLIYLCFPNNPTGTVLDKTELEKWVKYAKENKSIMLYDAMQHMKHLYQKRMYHIAFMKYQELKKLQ